MGGLIGVGTLLRFSNTIVSSRTITVSGEGKTSIAPDLATISFSVISQGSSAVDIQKINTTKINRAITFVKDHGIKDTDIKTTGYNLYPSYRYDKNNGQSSISGYEITQTVTVKIRDLSTIGTIIGGLPTAGINQIGSLNYSIENPEAQRAQARVQAFARARDKAREMAAENGVSLLRVLTFSEFTGGNPGPIFYAAMEKGMDSATAPAPNIETGSQEVTIDVSVTYEIR